LFFFAGNAHEQTAVSDSIGSRLNHFQDKELLGLKAEVPGAEVVFGWPENVNPN
jgi:hypothetical protein